MVFGLFFLSLRLIRNFQTINPPPSKGARRLIYSTMCIYPHSTTGRRNFEKSSQRGKMPQTFLGLNFVNKGCLKKYVYKLRLCPVNHWILAQILKPLVPLVSLTVNKQHCKKQTTIKNNYFILYPNIFNTGLLGLCYGNILSKRTRERERERFKWCDLQAVQLTVSIDWCIAKWQQGKHVKSWTDKH